MSLDLRERLRSVQRPSRVETGRASPLPSLVPLENEQGTTYYNDKIWIERHGQIDLKDFPDIRAETIRFLARDPSVNDFNVREAVFLDIETTGTAGGTGTYAFLVGLGFLDQGYFQVRQFFLHDLAQEAAFLHAIADFSQKFRYLITYNGKCFDTQILRNRYLMHRREDPISDKQHIDMLFVARRLWKRRFGECDLTNLERNVLNFHRVDDIPSFLIPSAYTDYLRFANGSMIQKVIHHNQWDILSLAVLTARACLLPGGREEDLAPEEHFSLSLLYEWQRDFSKAIGHQLEAIRQNGGVSAGSILLALARNLRRVKDLGQMRWLLQQVQMEALEGDLCRQLCILCEHDLRDYELALQLTDLQIQRLEKFRGLGSRYNELCETWHHRRKRLLKKMEPPRRQVSG